MMGFFLKETRISYQYNKLYIIHKKSHIEEKNETNVSSQWEAPNLKEENDFYKIQPSQKPNSCAPFVNPTRVRYNF